MIHGRFDGKRARLIRQHRGLSYGDVACVMHVTQSVIKDWERGKLFEPSDRQIARLADIYQCSSEELRRW